MILTSEAEYSKSHFLTKQTKSQSESINKYKLLVHELIDKFNSFLNEILLMETSSKSTTETKKKSPISLFYNEFKLSKYDLQLEIKKFTDNESALLKELQESTRFINNSKIKSKRKSTNYNSYLEKICKEQKDEIDKLNMDLIREKRKTVNTSKMNVIRQSSEFKVDIDSSLSKLKTLNLPDKIDIHNLIDLDDNANSDDELSHVLGQLNKKKPIKHMTSTSPRKRFTTIGDKQKQSFFNSKHSFKGKDKRSRSIYGLMSFEGRDDDNLSIKSDLSRNKQEIMMLNKEINILRRETLKKDKEIDTIKEKHQEEAKKQKIYNSNIIKNLQKNLEEKDKELSNLSHSVIEHTSPERQLKAVDTLKRGLDNLIEDKKELKQVVQVLEKENESLKKRLEILKETVDKFKEDFQRVEEVNRNLADKMFSYVQRETNLVEKVNKLSTKLKAYNKFFEDKGNK